MIKNKSLINYEKHKDFWKILNYIAVSDSEDYYINKKYLKRARILKFIYLIFVVSIIFISFIPLFFQAEFVTSHDLYSLTFNYIVFFVLLFDYFLRWITFPLRIENKRLALLFWPFTGIAIVMFFSFFPSFIIIFLPSLLESNSNSEAAQFIKIVNSLVFLRLGRLILFLNVLRPFRSIKNVFYKQRVLLFNVFLFLVIIAVLFALIIFQAEVKQPGSKIFNYWDAFYFTIITLTTIGYGDISPVTQLGQAMVVILAIIGVAIFTIPSAIIAGGFLQELQENKNTKKEEKKEEKSTFFQRVFFKSTETISKMSKYTSRPISKNSFLSEKEEEETKLDNVNKEKKDKTKI